MNIHFIIKYLQIHLLSEQIKTVYYCQTWKNKLLFIK